MDVENEAMLKIVELEKQLMQTNKELDQLRVGAVTMENIITLIHLGDMLLIKLHVVLSV